MEDIGSKVQFLAKKVFFGYRPNLTKNQKKYRTVYAVGPEHTSERMDAYTHKSEFIGSFRSPKTTGESIIPVNTT